VTKRNLVILWPVLAATALCLLSCWNNIPPFVWEEAQNTDKVLTGDEVTVSARANDPEGGKVALRLFWGDGDTSQWSAAITENEQVTFAHSYAVGGHFPIRVQGRDVSGRLSDWLGDIDQKVFDTAQVKWIERVYAMAGTCPALAADGTIYVATGLGLRALSPDATIIWTASGYGKASPVIGPDGTVYAVSHYALGAFSPAGTLLWCDTLPQQQVEASPAVGTDGTIYISDEDSLIAFNADGSRRWAYTDTAGRGFSSSPVVGADGTVYVVLQGNGTRLLALNPDGSLNWSYGTEDWYSTELAISDDGIIYAWGGDYLWAISPDGTNLWQHGAGYRARELVIGQDGTAYVLRTYNDGVDAWNPDGTTKWRFNAEGSWSGRTPGTPALAQDGVLCLSGGDDTLRFLNSDGTMKTTFECDAPVTGSPTIAPDGTIYVSTEDGCLYALKGSSPLAGGGWPKYQCNAGNSGRAGSAANRERSSR
jgi:hypothetical protein